MLMLSMTLCLIATTLLVIVLQKTYSQVPAKEMKRRAQTGDRQAQALYRAAGHGLSLKVFLNLLAGLSTAGLFVVLARALAWPLAVLAIVTLVVVGFIWLPHTRVTKASQRIAITLAPVFAWLLDYLHGPLQLLGMFILNHTSVNSHTRLYEKADLIELLEQQESQADNRMTKQEIDMASHALSFGDRLVRDTFIPISQVISVNANDSLGPLLMGELHDSGHSRFPVYDGKHNNIVGILYLHDLLEKRQGGTVREILQKQVVYVHEEQDLYHVLQAFLKTKRHLFVVVNRFEEVLGVITIEDVLEQVIGRSIMDEFDQYEDLRAVAGHVADKIHRAQKHETLPPEAPEVVE